MKCPTDAHLGLDTVLSLIVDMVNTLRQQFVNTGELVGMGLGIPGLVDPKKGVIVSAGHLQWFNVPVAELLRKRTGLPVYIDNDVRMYMYGEAVAGAGRGYSHILGITIGTGISAAMINDEKLFYGYKAMSGEIGHVQMEGVSEKCVCGLSACLETVASASGMVAQAKKAIATGRSTILTEWFPGETINQLTAAHISKALDTGDTLANEIITRAGKWIGQALASVVTVLSPEVIIVGGGGALAGERIMSPLRQELNKLLLSDYSDGLHIVLAEHNEDAGIIGSSIHARQQLERIHDQS